MRPSWGQCGCCGCCSRVAYGFPLTLALPLSAIDRNLMRMYVILAVLGLLLLVSLICFVSMTVRARSAARSERRREEVAARLAPLVAQAAQEYQTRTAAAQVSEELTTVLPAIRPDDGQQPRRVA